MTNGMKNLARYLWIASSAMLITGCGSDLVPAEGVVTIDGKPVKGAMVVFIPDPPDSKDREFPFSGIGEDGAIAMNTGKRAGVRPGKYKVTVSKVKISFVAEDPKKIDTR